jgi:hypothetical protein
MVICYQSTRRVLVDPDSGRVSKFLPFDYYHGFGVDVPTVHELASHNFKMYDLWGANYIYPTLYKHDDTKEFEFREGYYPIFDGEGDYRTDVNPFSSFSHNQIVEMWEIMTNESPKSRLQSYLQTGEHNHAISFLDWLTYNEGFSKELKSFMEGVKGMYEMGFYPDFIGSRNAVFGWNQDRGWYYFVNSSFCKDQFKIANINPQTRPGELMWFIKTAFTIIVICQFLEIDQFVDTTAFDQLLKATKGRQDLVPVKVLD